MSEEEYLHAIRCHFAYKNRLKENEVFAEIIGKTPTDHNIYRLVYPRAGGMVDKTIDGDFMDEYLYLAYDWLTEYA